MPLAESSFGQGLLFIFGNGMRDRTIKAQVDAKKEFDSYVREQANAGVLA
jgi:hypothetical protein